MNRKECRNCRGPLIRELTRLHSNPTTSGMGGLSYEASGVNYDRLDAFKRACQRAASATAPMLAHLGLSEPAGVRGEMPYLIETPDEFLAHVEEGLGTKNLIADEMGKLSGKGGWYRSIGIDVVATIVNDLITSGAAPLSVAMHAAVGDDRWFSDAQRRRSGGWICRRVQAQRRRLGRR